MRDFAALHVPANPVILYNIWDAGSARAIADAGAKALATGSWSVAAAQGYGDGEHMPRALVLANLARIVATTPLPVTLDFERGYGADAAEVADSAAQALATGAVGINLEDGTGDASAPLRAIDAQAARIAAIRAATSADFFINARCDHFLIAPADQHDEALFAQALSRARAYADAGASGFFVPGLVDQRMIARLCERIDLPINIMAVKASPDAARLAELGVARISHGPAPFRLAMAALTEGARGLYQTETF